MTYQGKPFDVAACEKTYSTGVKCPAGSLTATLQFSGSLPPGITLTSSTISFPAPPGSGPANDNWAFIFQSGRLSAPPESDWSKIATWSCWTNDGCTLPSRFRLEWAS